VIKTTSPFPSKYTGSSSTVTQVSVTTQADESTQTDTTTSHPVHDVQQIWSYHPSVQYMETDTPFSKPCQPSEWSSPNEKLSSGSCSGSRRQSSLLPSNLTSTMMLNSSPSDNLESPQMQRKSFTTPEGKHTPIDRCSLMKVP